MNDFLALAGITKYFAPQLSLGDRIAARLGGHVEVRQVHAVDDVTLSIAKGKTLGLVGESGCGKSTLGRIAAGILQPTHGEVLLDDQPVRAQGRKTVTRIQTVFQDPYASLNPRMQIGAILAEGPLVHGLVTKNKAADYIADWLDLVGLDASYADRYPHQFSGGQRQRIAIARALAMQPDVLICDEPVASLDVSIQAQIINLFLKLRRELSITCLFISHDLTVVRHISDRIAIMYLGHIVELGDTQKIYETPQHPYTQALLDSVPKLVLRDDMLVELKAIEGELPSPLDPPPGCRFHPRCPIAQDSCRVDVPELRLINSEADRRVACHLAR